MEQVRFDRLIGPKANGRVFSRYGATRIGAQSLDALGFIRLGVNICQ